MSSSNGLNDLNQFTSTLILMLHKTNVYYFLLRKNEK